MKLPQLIEELKYVHICETEFAVRYLLVDRNMDFAFVLEMYLTIEGHDIVVAMPHEAILVIDEFDFDGYLMDFRSITDGLAASLAEKRKTSGDRKFLMIFWSGDALNANRQPLQCDYFLMKPFSVEALSKLLRESS